MATHSRYGWLQSTISTTTIQVTVLRSEGPDQRPLNAEPAPCGTPQPSNPAGISVVRNVQPARIGDRTSGEGEKTPEHRPETHRQEFFNRIWVEPPSTDERCAAVRRPRRPLAGQAWCGCAIELGANADHDRRSNVGPAAGNAKRWRGCGQTWPHLRRLRQFSANLPPICQNAACSAATYRKWRVCREGH